MSLRGVLAAALLVAAAGVAVPAQAATSPYVFYEAVRIKPGGATHIPIVVKFDGAGLYGTLDLAPSDGGGYTQHGWGVGLLGSGKSSTLWTFDVAAGHRYVLFGPRGHTHPIPLGRFWKVRATTGMALRTVTPHQADTEYHDVAGVSVQVFHSATAPGGPYGSLAFGSVPCANGAGRWTFGSNTEPDNSPDLCLGGTWAWRETYAGRTWTVAGPVVGQESGDFLGYRLLVIDYPKR